MSHRLKHLIEEVEGQDEPLYEIEAGFQTYLASQPTALDVERELVRVPQPGWVEFDDVFGVRHRILAWEVRRVSELTPVKRAAWRAFMRTRH